MTVIFEDKARETTKRVEGVWYFEASGEEVGRRWRKIWKIVKTDGSVEKLPMNGYELSRVYAE